MERNQRSDQYLTLAKECHGKRALTKKILTYHVVTGKVMSDDISKLKSAASVEGSNVKIDLPQAYQLEGEEAYIKKIGNVILLIPKDRPWQTLFSSLELFSDDFMEQREQPLQIEREALFE